MDKQISIEQISKFSEEYNKNRNNKIIENAITKNGLENACIDRQVIIENVPIFNVELPESTRYDQKDSYKCWIYAGINVIKHNIAQNLNIDIMKLELSNNFIAFFDKLEKSNNAYENIIELENTDLDYIHKEKIVEYCVSEGGYWQWFVSIINKYGIVPMSFMPDVVESTNYEKVSDIFTEKVKKDISYLLKLKNENESIERLRSDKERFLQENYNLLSKILGEPNFKFDYEYKDKNNKYIRYKDMTPIEFKNKFLTLDLNNFLSIGNLPMYNKEYYKIYSKKYLGNIYKDSYATFLNLPIEDLKDLAIKQLKDGIPVWMGAHIMKFRDKKSGILDIRLYDYRDTLNFNPLSKKEALDLHDIEMHHAMTFCGVHLLENKPVKWKIEDSYGNKEKVNGYYIMNDNFFNEFVLSVVIDKKYLTEEQLKLLEQEPIEFDVGEPF